MTTLKNTLNFRLSLGRLVGELELGGQIVLSSEGKKDKCGEEASGLWAWAGSYFPTSTGAADGGVEVTGAPGGFSSSPEPVWVLGGASSLRGWAGL